MENGIINMKKIFLLIEREIGLRNLFPFIITIIVFSFDMSLVYFIKAYVTRKHWIETKRLDLRTEMMWYTTLSSFLFSIWSLGLDITFKLFIVNNFLESLFSYFTNFLLVILGLSAAKIFYDRHRWKKSSSH